MALQQRMRGARGAVLIHVSIIMIAMIALSALAIDLGVNYVSRGQAQTAADSAALAAAISRSFVAPGNITLAQQSAVLAARANNVWDDQPDIIDADVTFPTCPAGSPGVAGTCAQAEVFRTTYGRASGNPLPTFFAQLVGLNEQGAKARAVAQMLAGNGTADCVKPWALADKWVENRNPAIEFNRYVENGQNRGQLLSGAVDVYDANDPNGGYQLPQDRGTHVLLYEGNPQQTIRPGFFFPVRLDGNGANPYEDAIRGCVTRSITPGMTLPIEPGRMVGPTRHGFEDLIALDPLAQWNATTNAPERGCMDASPPCARSPRWVAVPVFDIDSYLRARYDDLNAGGNGANIPVTVVKVIGVFIDEVRNNGDIYGYINHYPTTSITGPGNTAGGGAFARTVILVR